MQSSAPSGTWRPNEIELMKQAVQTTGASGGTLVGCLRPDACKDANVNSYPSARSCGLNADSQRRLNSLAVKTGWWL